LPAGLVNFYQAALGGELDGVRQEVVQYLAEQHLVGEYPAPGRQGVANFHPFLGGQRGHGRHGLFGQRPRVAKMEASGRRMSADNISTENQ